MNNLSRSPGHDVRTIITVEELIKHLNLAIQEGGNNLKVRITTGPKKTQSHLVSGVYYSPDTKSIWIEAES